MMRRILILSYYFPPSSEVASKPTARLARHLPDFGWEPVVVAPPVEVYAGLDHQAYADVLRNVRVERTGYGRSARDVFLATKRRVAEIVGRRDKIDVDGGAPQAPATSASPPPAPRGLRGKLRQLFCFPDMYTGWIGPAYRRAAELLRDESFDAVMSISPVVSAHLAARRLQRRFPRVPWVVQYHDPWSGNPYKQWQSQALVSIERRLEASVVRRADRLVCATDEAAALLQRQYHPARPVLTIENGFDPLDFPETSPARRADHRLTFTYTGSLYWSRNPFPFFEALRNVIRAGKLNTDAVRVRLIGGCDSAQGRSVAAVAKELGLANIVEIEPPVPYPDALRALAEADVMVLFAEEQPLQIPAKAFEYLHIGRPILALASGATARLVAECGAGQAVESNDLAGIEAAIVATAAKARDDGPDRERRAELAAAYRADRLAGKLADALNELCPSRGDRKLDGQLVRAPIEVASTR